MSVGTKRVHRYTVGLTVYAKPTISKGEWFSIQIVSVGRKYAYGMSEDGADITIDIKNDMRYIKGYGHVNEIHATLPKTT